MSIANSVLSCKLGASFLIFPNSFFLVKIVNHYEVHVIFLGIEHQLKINMIHRFPHYNFL